MRATVMYEAGDVRVEDVPDATIVEPTDALMLGDHRYGARMEHVSRDAEEAHIGALRSFAARAEAIPVEGLGEQDAVSREVLLFLTTAEADLEETRPAEVEVNPTMGFHALLPVTFAQLPLTEPEHADDFVAKLHELGRMFDEAAQRLREGVGAGRTPIGLHTAAVAAQIDAHLQAAPEEDPYLAVRPPAGLGDAQTAA